MSMDASALWARLRPDARGLVTAVVQHEATGQILMVGHMNAQALAATLEHGRVTFWSRSRDELWEKGATSGNTLRLVELRVGEDVLARGAGRTKKEAEQRAAAVALDALEADEVIGIS